MERNLPKVGDVRQVLVRAKKDGPQTVRREGRVVAVKPIGGGFTLIHTRVEH